VSAVDDLLVGAVDLHTHSGPSPMPRRIDHVEAARQAAEAGFRAIVAKCHYHNTVFDVLAMQPQLAGLPIEVFGGMALNSVVGGLNPHAADLALKMGGRILWFPTISSRAHLDHAAHDAEVQSHFQPHGIMQSELVDVFDEKGDVRPEVETIVGMAKEAGALVSTGHLDAVSARAVVETAQRLGHHQVIISHPNYVSDIDKQQVLELTRAGAFVEHEVAMYAFDKIYPLEVLVEWIRAIGPEHTTLGSDLGQVGNPLPVEGYRRLVERLLDAGIGEADIRLMIRDNPARLIGLDR